MNVPHDAVPTASLPPTEADGNDPSAVLARELESLDGYTINDLADYLDAGRVPFDPVIEVSPQCQRTLTALTRLRNATDTLFREEVAREEPQIDAWTSWLWKKSALESREGRLIPRHTSAPETDLHITENALKELIRNTGDTVPGILMGRSAFIGDVTVVGARVAVDIEATIIWRHNIPAATADLRHVIHITLMSNIDFAVTAINVTVTDIFNDQH